MTLLPWESFYDRFCELDLSSSDSGFFRPAFLPYLRLEVLRIAPAVPLRLSRLSFLLSSWVAGIFWLRDDRSLWRVTVWLTEVGAIDSDAGSSSDELTLCPLLLPLRRCFLLLEPDGLCYVFDDWSLVGILFTLCREDECLSFLGATLGATFWVSLILTSCFSNGSVMNTDCLTLRTIDYCEELMLNLSFFFLLIYKMFVARISKQSGEHTDQLAEHSVKQDRLTLNLLINWWNKLGLESLNWICFVINLKGEESCF